MKKRILLLLLFFLILGSVVAFYIISQPPKEKLSEEFKEKAVTELLGRKAQLNPVEEKQGNTKYEGKNITFEYPAKALIYTFRDKDSALVEDEEDFSFDLKSPRVTFSMKNSISAQNLSDNPSVRLREQRDYEYKKSEVTADNVKGVSFYKAGSSPEKSGFFVTNGRLYIFSVTGISEKDVVNLFDGIISTVTFTD